MSWHRDDAQASPAARAVPLYGAPPPPSPPSNDKPGQFTFSQVMLGVLAGFIMGWIASRMHLFSRLAPGAAGGPGYPGNGPNGNPNDYY